MTTKANTSGYSRRQTAPLWLMLLGIGAAAVMPAVLTGGSAGVVVAGRVGVVVLSLAFCFRYLAVEDRGDHPAVRFGPLPLFRRTVRYVDVGSAEVGRTLLLDGWGIHLSIRGGWVWNLWGRSCVVVHFRDGRTLRIGTDDADHLAEFLRGVIGERK